MYGLGEVVGAWVVGGAVVGAVVDGGAVGLTTCPWACPTTNAVSALELL